MSRPLSQTRPEDRKMSFSVPQQRDTSLFRHMAPGLRAEIDLALMAQTASMAKLAERYNLTPELLLARKKEIFAAIQEKELKEVGSQCLKALEWAQERIKEFYMEARAATVTPDPTKPEMVVKTPDRPMMLEAIREMKELGRLYGEVEQKVGKLAEIRLQKELGVGIGAPGGGNTQIGIGGMGGGPINVLVMPKAPGMDVMVPQIPQFPAAASIPLISSAPADTPSEDELDPLNVPRPPSE